MTPKEIQSDLPFREGELTSVRPNDYSASEAEPRKPNFSVVSEKIRLSGKIGEHAALQVMEQIGIREARHGQEGEPDFVTPGGLFEVKVSNGQRAFDIGIDQFDAYYAFAGDEHASLQYIFVDYANKKRGKHAPEGTPPTQLAGLAPEYVQDFIVENIMQITVVDALVLESWVHGNHRIRRRDMSDVRTKTVKIPREFLNALHGNGEYKIVDMQMKITNPAFLNGLGDRNVSVRFISLARPVDQVYARGDETFDDASSDEVHEDTFGDVPMPPEEVDENQPF